MRLGDALADPLPSADAAVVNVALDVDLEVAAGLDCQRVIVSGYLSAEEPELPGYLREARREAEGWAADLFRAR